MIASASKVNWVAMCSFSPVLAANACLWRRAASSTSSGDLLVALGMAGDAQALETGVLQHAGVDDVERAGERTGRLRQIAGDQQRLLDPAADSCSSAVCNACWLSMRRATMCGDARKPSRCSLIAVCTTSLQGRLRSVRYIHRRSRGAACSRASVASPRREWRPRSEALRVKSTMARLSAGPCSGAAAGLVDFQALVGSHGSRLALTFKVCAGSRRTFRR